MNVVSLITGKSRQLDGRVASEEIVTEADAGDLPKLAKLLTSVLRQLADLKRRVYPRRTDFEDIDLPAGALAKFSHRFGGRVRWYVIDVIGDQPGLSKDSSTDANTLVLWSAVATRITLRVEEAG